MRTMAAPKTRTLQVRVTADEHETFLLAARASGLSDADALRLAAREFALAVLAARTHDDPRSLDDPRAVTTPFEEAPNARAG
jgi:hypothetical protein